MKVLTPTDSSALWCDKEMANVNGPCLLYLTTWNELQQIPKTPQISLNNDFVSRQKGFNSKYVSIHYHHKW